MYHIVSVREAPDCIPKPATGELFPTQAWFLSAQAKKFALRAFKHGGPRFVGTIHCYSFTNLNTIVGT